MYSFNLCDGLLDIIIVKVNSSHFVLCSMISCSLIPTDDREVANDKTKEAHSKAAQYDLAHHNQEAHYVENDEQEIGLSWLFHLLRR